VRAPDRGILSRLAASACAALGFMLIFARRQCRPVGFGPLISGHVAGKVLLAALNTVVSLAIFTLLFAAI
jgi:membrane protein